MCEEKIHAMFFMYADEGKGHVSGPISYSANGAEMYFDRAKDLMDVVLGRDNYVISTILMRPWYKNYIMSFELTKDFIDNGIPITMKVKDFCERAVRNFTKLVNEL